MKRLLTALGLAGLFALAAPVTASAASWAYADCSLQSNMCFGDGGSDSGPVTLIWQFDTNGTDAIFPQDCTNQTSCRFYCWRYEGPIVARLRVYGANFNLLAISDPSPGLCTQQDIILPWSTGPVTQGRPSMGLSSPAR